MKRDTLIKTSTSETNGVYMSQPTVPVVYTSEQNDPYKSPLSSTPLKKDKKYSSRSKLSILEKPERLDPVPQVPFSDDIAVVSDSVRHLIEDVDVKGAVKILKEGSFLLKYCYNFFRKPHQRLFWVDMETLAIKWSSPKKGPSRTQIFLTDVERIVPGIDSDFWRAKPDSERRLGIELLCHGRKLRLMCSKHDEWKIWLRGLLHAHQKAIAKRKRAGSLTNDFIQKQWALADLDHNGSMSFYELVHLLQRLNCRADVRYAEQLFEQFDEDGSSVLEFEEFKLLIHKLLTHDDIMVYYERYKDKRLQIVTEDGFKRFLLEVQHTPSHVLPVQLAEMHTLEEPFKNEEGLTDLGFNLLLTSDFNSILKPSKKILNPKEMMYPMTDYWISSSHNTYLTGDQMIGKSAVGQYIDVLLKGCRCVELDCWDGNDGEPIIYHGHTLTTKIPFSAVIKACRDYGFQKSPYPVILSLEMHCSPKQKKRVGEILVDLLGNRLYRHPVNGPIPSPHDLKGYFLVKGRVPNESGEEIEEGNENDLLLDEEELQLELLSEYPIGCCSDLPIGFGTFLNHSDHPYLAVEHYSNEVQDDQQVHTTLIGNKNLSTTKEHLKIYYSTISLTGRRLASFDKDKRNQMDICSLNEKKFNRLIKLDSEKFALFHQKYFSRVYPSGTRIMSSNFNPMTCWLYGCQMAALNFQALGLATLLNLGRFLENGSVGYVLKPAILRNPQLPFNPLSPNTSLFRMAQEAPVQVTIQVLAAQQLPRPSVDDRGKKKDTACPFVVISLQGLKRDISSKKTAYVPNNGLNPRWTDQIFLFEVTAPSLSIFVFEVRHYDSVGSDFLAGTAAPVSCIRPGVRWLTLYDSKLREIHWSGLLVHVTIKPIKHLDTYLSRSESLGQIQSKVRKTQGYTEIPVKAVNRTKSRDHSTSIQINGVHNNNYLPLQQSIPSSNTIKLKD